MQGIVETIQAGEKLNNGQQGEVVKIFLDFINSDVYKIIAAYNMNEIKRLASLDDDNARGVLGKIQGIQDGFENRVKMIIAEAKMEIENKKIANKYKKEAGEEDGEPKAEEITSTSSQAGL